MLADKNRARALANEQTIADLGDWVAKSHVRPTVIEDYWGAAFHWIAYATQTKYGKHKDKHKGLGPFLRNDLHEPTIAVRSSQAPSPLSEDIA
ncbi:MAG TPA: hypothetical protein VF120_12485 [Ktedonobacterales bacterium]